MNLPPLPTDNLYKFCAVIGVVMTLFGIYVPYILVDELFSKLDATALQVKQLRIEFSFLKTEQEHTERTSIAVLSKKPTSLRTSKRQASAETNTARIKETTSAPNQTAKDIELKMAEVEANANRLDRLYLQFKIVLALAAVTVFFGILLAQYGFINWYRRVQRPQDDSLAGSTRDAA